MNLALFSMLPSLIERQVVDGSTWHGNVQASVDALIASAGQVGVKSLARACGVSHKRLIYQSHFLREFRSFTGSSPCEYLRANVELQAESAEAEVNFLLDGI